MQIGLPTWRRSPRGWRVAIAAVTLLGLAVFAAAAQAAPGTATRIWAIHYRAWDGKKRNAYVILPAWYGPRDHPAIPLVISPHGRGVKASDNVRLWGPLPAVGAFAVVNPEGQGRHLTLDSWGAPGQISDLARMPAIAEHGLPWLRIDRQRIYAIGGSMGGQETLLLVAAHPREFAGAISFDADTNLALRYRDFDLVSSERHLQGLARLEVGGTPRANPIAYARRSPLDEANELAYSEVPLELWWSTRDKIVIDQARNTGALFRRIIRLNPGAPIIGVRGTWAHTAEMWYFRRLPSALALMGLLPARDAHPFHELDAHRVKSPSSGVNVEL